VEVGHAGNLSVRMRMRMMRARCTHALLRSVTGYGTKAAYTVLKAHVIFHRFVAAWHVCRQTET
jgi:hypothetical protein